MLLHFLQALKMAHDPRNIENIGDFVSMGKNSKPKYVKTWLSFCDSYGITIDNIPKEEDFMDYFRQKSESGTTFGVMKSYFSHLNKACIVLYGWKLQKWPGIFAFIKSCNVVDPLEVTGLVIAKCEILIGFLHGQKGKFTNFFSHWIF